VTGAATAVAADADGRYLSDLLDTRFTPQQLDIITAELAPQLVIAGAGSGKTMVMAARVVHAVAYFGVPPAQILGLTFTNKAAGELADRVRRCLAELPPRHDPADPDVAESDDAPTVATYNSYAAQIVRDHALRIGREPGAALLTEAVQWQLAMRVATRAPGPFAHLSWTTPYVAELIVALAGDLSDHLATAADVRRHDERMRAAITGLTDKPVAAAAAMVEKTLARDDLLQLVAGYTEEKRRLDVIDYGDQVALACAIATAAAEVATIERERFRLVVLDEYQDTGVSQRVLLSRLFAESHAVTAVGDPNQAIYGWRGASASNLLRFSEHFAPGQPPRDPQPLMTSFRCCGRVLDAANAVAGPLHESLAAKGRVIIDIPRLDPTDAARDSGEVVVARHETAADEAQWLAAKIRAAVDGGTAPREIAVLARRRADFARLHGAMADLDLPVEVVGLGGLLAMPEVSDIVAVLALLADSTANAAAVRLLTGPRWRLGVRDLAALGRRAVRLARDQSSEDSDAGVDSGNDADEHLAVKASLVEVLNAATSSVDPVEVASLLEAVEDPGPASRCSPEALERLSRFREEIQRLRQFAGQPLVDLITEIVSTTGLDVEIEAADPSLAEARLANVHAFLDVAAQFTGLDGEGDLGAFLAYLRAAADNEDGLDVAPVSDADTIKLMTVHAAKGLEWDLVAVPGLVDEVFPSNKSRSSWVTGAQVLPFACRGDRDDLPALDGFTVGDFKAFTDECRSDSKDEERRLAYVAMTRARHRLILSAYVWSPTRKTPCTISPFLDEVVALGDRAVVREQWVDDPEPGTDNPLIAEGVADIEWPVRPALSVVQRRQASVDLVEAARRRDGSIPRSSVGGPTAAGWRRDAELLLAEARRRRSRVIEVAVPARLTTSQVVALAEDPDAFAASIVRPMPARPVAQARRGSRFHQWVEQLYGVSPLLEPDDLPGAEDADLADADLAMLQERFLADGWGERLPVAVETPFETVVGGRLLRGRIDAVYATDGGGFDVIDYKTGAVLTGESFAAASHQLSIYRLAWADLMGVDPAVVQAGFLYVRTGTVKRPQHLLDREELASLLTG
jgi:DNA helicase-2/ATP-dependent DNA helicase PcrA